MTTVAEWKIRMLIRALIRMFKTGITLLEKIERGEEVQ